MINDKESLDLLQKFAEAWNNHDSAALMACMTDDCVFYTAAGTGERGNEFKGSAAVKSAYEAVWQRYPDAAWREAKHFVQGNRGVSEWLFTGSTPDGKEKCVVRGVDLFVLKDGKIQVKDTYRKQIVS